ncbi:MAG TPA: TetR/AcrR family transcriptional regulator [Pseudonocardiaceae bacterium]|jgi:AcrR family transcriptional regulator|nr:TetR/AcrR family transcriptional regulator [Pseudonocardiaceae bacterium]
MTEERARADRGRAETDRRIRTVARTLLVEHGAQGVTLRAIARQIGITAPALYRYYASLSDLIQHVVGDICADLADDMGSVLADLPGDDTAARVFAVCRGFRTWAIAHPREFSLVFATPADPRISSSNDPFGRIFLTFTGRILASSAGQEPPDPDVPERLRADIERFHDTLVDALRGDQPEPVIGLGTAYTVLRFWVRLYGQVALEVFGRFPFPVTDAAPLFESMLAELAAEVGLS